jgi:hypothetical protein
MRTASNRNSGIDFGGALVVPTRSGLLCGERFTNSSGRLLHSVALRLGDSRAP